MATATSWCETEELWEAWAPFGFDEARIAAAPGEVDLMTRTLGLTPGMSVLDLCCGVGRHTLEFARRGYRVVGVDRNEQYLSQAARRAEAEGLDIELVRSDMRRFSRPGAFDAAINYFTSFGYFEDEADQQCVIGNLHESLRPGGRLLMELMGKEVIARIFRPRDWHELNGAFLFEQRRPVDHWRYIQTRWTFVDKGERQDFDLRLRCFSAVEIERLLTDNRFTDVEVFGDLAGAPYDQDAQRLVVTARRPMI